MRWLRRRGADARLDFRPCQEGLPEMVRAGLTVSDCRRAAYVVELPADAVPKVHRGAAAVNLALRRLPGRLGWRLLGTLYLLPVIRQVEDAAYAWAARNRHRLGRSSGSCSLR